MNYNHCLEETEVIKFAAESYVGVGGNPKKLFAEAVQWLYECYKQTNDFTCLKAAKQIIDAYMELGLLYDSVDKIFDPILAEMGTTFEKEFPRRRYSANVLKQKVVSVREVLGFWSSKSLISADYVAEDIIEKLQSKEYGCYYYGKRENEISFELLILKEDAYLMDIEKQRIYLFEKA